MPVEFHPDSFDEQDIDCPKCKWRGKGADAIIIDLYGVAKSQEVHCPKCDVLVGTLPKQKGPGGESATDLSFQLG